MTAHAPTHMTTRIDGQRSPDRVNSRNCYRQRPWDTRAGTIDPAIQRLRSGSAFPEWLPSVTPRASNGDCLPVLLEGPVEASVAEGAFGAGAAQRLACDTPLVAAPAAGGRASRATRLRRSRRAVCFLLVSGC